jgi:hypothetical protein
MAHDEDVSSLPVLAELARQNGIPIAVVERLLRSDGLPGALAEELTRLGVHQFRSLDRWGESAEYTRALEQALMRSYGE